MAKVLLTQKNIEEYLCRETGSLHVDRGMILSPGTKDYLQNIGITVQYGPRPAPAGARPETPATTVSSPAADHPVDAGDITTLTKRIVAILQDEYHVEDKEKLQELCLQVVRNINI
jgi:hypothetical protein